MPVGGPVEAPAQADVVVGLSAGRQIPIGRGEHARVDPVAAGCRTIIFERAEAAQVVASGDVVAVDLFQHPQTTRLVLDAPFERFRRLWLVVPGEIEEALVARQRASRVELLEALAELIGEPQVGARIAGWVRGFFVPLQQAMRVGEAALAFCVVCGG